MDVWWAVVKLDAAGCTSLSKLLEPFAGCVNEAPWTRVLLLFFFLPTPPSFGRYLLDAPSKLLDLKASSLNQPGPCACCCWVHEDSWMSPQVAVVPPCCLLFFCWMRHLNHGLPPFLSKHTLAFYVTAPPGPTIKQQFDESWLTWGSIPKSTRDVFFDRFKRKVSWKPEDEEKSQELGQSVHVDEIFQQTHSRQSTGEFVDERSTQTHEQFVAKFSQIRSETASVDVSASSPLDPTEEERIKNRCWLEAAGGKYKGRVYGIGNVTSQDDCVDSYIQQTQASSTAQQQNSQEIVNLKSQLQQYAATAAQDFLNLQNPQVQNEVPNDVQPQQQPPKQQPPHQQPPDEQPQDGNDYMHY
ncbi:hypothetical protein LR48_Vigan09g077400 [Vigna angularis]|uniref:Uncharacterized protein n=1 Tax=Phaseolus angularis TaxID=3914 RepID=A0A0L9VAL6_PHAAN|nr:hypothetical protein LR48_Vigan09g077400 [Vigna angularis]